MRKGHQGSAPAATRRRGQHMSATARRSAQAAFLVALRDATSVRAACRTSALGKSSVYRWAASDRGFAAQLTVHPARHETSPAPERPPRVLPVPTVGHMPLPPEPPAYRPASRPPGPPMTLTAEEEARLAPWLRLLASRALRAWQPPRKGRPEMPPVRQSDGPTRAGA